MLAASSALGLLSPSLAREDACLPTALPLSFVQMRAESFNTSRDDVISAANVSGSESADGVGPSGDSTNSTLFFVHIAKTAGASAIVDLPRYHLRTERTFESDEVCALTAPRDAELITFLREPRAHVLSQYEMCRYRKKHPELYMHPVSLPDSLNAWLHHWVAAMTPMRVGNASVDFFYCYMPLNLQARLLSCNGIDFNPGRDEVVLNDTVGKYNVNLELAMSQIKEKFTYVGVTELYQESMCLVHVIERDEFPPYCDCENRSAWSTFPETHVRHGVEAHSVRNLKREDARLIDDLTAEDRRLYDAALQRLTRDIHRVEAKFGKKILCRQMDAPSVEVSLRSGCLKHVRHRNCFLCFLLIFCSVRFTRVLRWSGQT
eukprot:TRINITY_DN3311_c0_g3_i1.p1 TRINITY_DN3311_c0_g3~~TRINITY_DN3311_c0_g3_i1.p1  ORF type:complete len:421 (-),score=55.85 TRINITY_DN3311_c0_g3_i1:105-1232(-)